MQIKFNGEFLRKYISRKYINVWIAFIVGTVLVASQCIEGWQWVVIAVIFAFGYPLFNIIEKIKIQDIKDVVKSVSVESNDGEENHHTTHSQIPNDNNLK